MQYQLKSKRTVDITLLSGRVASIQCPSAAFVDVKRNDHKEIISICYENDKEFKINDELWFELSDTVKSKFVIKEIVKNTEPGKFYLSCEKRSYSTYFILPLISHLNQTIDWWEITKDGSPFINAHIDENGDNLIIVLRYIPGYEFHRYDEKLKQHDLYYDFKDPDFYTVAYYFHIPDHFKKDVEFFKLGKYSKLSDVSKKRILNFHTNRERKKEIKEILERSPRKKKDIEDKLLVDIPDDIDLLSKPDLMLEYYG